MESIFLEGSDGVVNVHPLPIFAILDHHGRRKMNLDRVLGALLGRVNNGVIEVTDAFGVYHEEELKPGATIGDVRICFAVEQSQPLRRRGGPVIRCLSPHQSPNRPSRPPALPPHSLLLLTGAREPPGAE